MGMAYFRGDSPWAFGNQALAAGLGKAPQQRVYKSGGRGSHVAPSTTFYISPKHPLHPPEMPAPRESYPSLVTEVYPGITPEK